MSSIRRKTQKEALRKKSLGELGELVAIKALVDNKYLNIRNLNDVRSNFPYADLYAEKAGEGRVISVKARNKYQVNGNLNGRYKLGQKAHIYAEEAEREFNAKAYWMAIPFDDSTYSIYMGTLEELGGNLGIPIKKCIDGLVGKCLVNERRHFFDFEYFTNRRK